jgi:chromate transporter
MKQGEKLKEIAQVFFKMGCFAFGGPAAHIAMMEQEIVQKRKWMNHSQFLDLIGATNLIPGPNSTEMTMHCGRERAGILGLFVAGFCFIFPAVILTGILGWIYVEYGQLPQIEALFVGIKPAVLVIILMTSINLTKKAVKNIEIGAFGVITLIGYFFHINEITLLFGMGTLGAFYFYFKNNRTVKANSLWLLTVTPLKLTTAIPTIHLFWTFLKIGSILYGGGYVLFAYLDAELVAHGILSRQQLLDAIAVGQFTPGPVLSTATFIGYQIQGTSGALLATAGIFLPSFLFVLLLNPLIPKMRESKFFSHFLNTVNIVSVALLIGVLISMGTSVLIEWKSIVIFGVFLLLQLKFKKINAIWIVIGGACLGYILTQIP